ncbi:MAG: zinc-ribbon domain-containing protein [Ktedonobacteraceae bacterium]
MNCPNCNAPLEINARFCPKCGGPVATAAANNVNVNASPTVQAPSSNEPPTLPLSHQQEPQRQPPAQAPWFSPQQAHYSQQAAPPAEKNTLVSSRGTAPQPRRRRGGCLATSLTTLVVLALLFTAGWFFGLRPYLHSMAQNQIDQAFTEAVQQMPPQVSQAPSGPFIFTEDLFNNLIQINIPPNSIVKQVAAHITATNIRIDFQVYGMQCDVTGVPQVVNKQLVATNVQVEGILALIMSNDEMTATLNKHLVDAQTKLNHPILGVHLEDQKMVMTLGPTNGGGTPGDGTPPPLP